MFDPKRFDTLEQFALYLYSRMPSGIDALAFIAGGCFRSYYDGTAVKDIDLFFASHEDYETAWNFFVAYDSGFSGTADEHGIWSFTCDNDASLPPINLIGFRHFGTLRALVESFDFRCCCIGVEKVDIETLHIERMNGAMGDAVTKTLWFSNPQNYDRAIKRIARYESYGYVRGFSDEELEATKLIPATGGSY